MTNKLIQGFEDFKRYQYEDGTALMPRLVEDGQDPDFFIISCIDSRANPATIFRVRPGTFLGFKVMGAIVRPYNSGTALAASLQFALKYAGVKTIVILGHTHCGAIEALIKNTDDPEIASFIDVAQCALTRAKTCCSPHEDLSARTVQETVLQSIQNIKTYPSVATALAEKRLEIKPWVFDMQQGNLLEYDVHDAAFNVITTHESTKDSRDNA